MIMCSLVGGLMGLVIGMVFGLSITPAKASNPGINSTQDYFDVSCRTVYVNGQTFYVFKYGNDIEVTR